MENAQLIGLSRQIALRRQMDVVANNVANINTTGFKAEDLLFEEYRMPVARDRDFPLPDQILSFTQDWATIHDLSAGSITQTGNTFDIALNGDAFFAVETTAGERYTRNGAFQIDNTGQLVDLNGNPVLSEAGPVRFDPSETGITFGADGSILSSAGNKGRLRLVDFENPQALTREGSNLFAGGTPVPATDTKVIQGAIERSNVSGVAEMASMIRVNRAYERIAKFMKAQGDLRQDAIRRLGEITA